MKIQSFPNYYQTEAILEDSTRSDALSIGFSLNFSWINLKEKVNKMNHTTSIDTFKVDEYTFVVPHNQKNSKNDSKNYSLI